MTPSTADPGSFRDPGGRVFVGDGRVFRAVYERSAADYEAARDSGLLTDLIARGQLVASREIEPQSHPAGADSVYLLEHPKLPFVSYPYEWPFSLHKKAALLQLDLLLETLERGFTLSDATAYNLQFLGTQPRFIDHLSFKRYRDGEIWTGHRQFCMQFLNPIVAWSRLGITPNAWFRGNLEGIAPEELAPLLRVRDKFSLTILSHVTAQAALQNRSGARPGGSAPAGKAQLSRTAFKAMLLGLKSFVTAARVPSTRTVWGGYDADNSYRGDEAETKRRFVQTMVAKVRPGLLFDLGCNSGEYSNAALDAGAGYVVGFDFDFGALEQAVQRADRGDLPFLPIWLDATNPSPAQGWNQRERKGFADRARGDAVIALAFIHHLAIAKNIPLDMAVEWIMAIAPAGVIEFPPKSDPMVQQLLSQREDIFPDYGEEQFLAAVERRGQIVATERLSPGGRLMVWFDRGAKPA